MHHVLLAANEAAAADLYEQGADIDAVGLGGGLGLTEQEPQTPA
jgi:hypothetical protein